MAHSLTQSAETATEVHFTCTVCGASIGFNKPDVENGGGFITQDLAGSWLVPENVDSFMGTLCTT